MTGSARGEKGQKGWGKGWRSGSFNVEGVGFNLWEGSFLILPVGSDGWLRARGASQGKGMGKKEGG